MARESRVENLLKSAIKANGGGCAKHTNPGERGDPDQLASWPWGTTCLIETKWATGEKPETHQERRHIYWREHGMDVWVCCDESDIERIIAYTLRAERLRAGGYVVLTGKSALDACGRPRIGEDLDSAQRAEPAKARRRPALSGLGLGTKESG